MTDRHKEPPMYVRPAGDDRAWVLAFASESGRAVNAVLAEAMAAPPTPSAVS